MAKCAICEKGAHFGNNVSHSHRRSNKMWKSNVKSVKVKTEGGAKKMYVCIFCFPNKHFLSVFENHSRQVWRTFCRKPFFNKLQSSFSQTDIILING